jgi:hypothetical protein
MIFIKKTISPIITIAVSCLTCTAFVLFSLPATICFSQETTTQTAVVKYYNASDLQSIADGIIEWEKTKLGIPSTESLLENTKFSSSAGESDNDWLALGVSRLHPEQNFPVYLEKLENKVLLYYRPLPTSVPTPTNAPTSKSKYSDYQRRAITMLSLRGDPRNIKYSIDGKAMSADVILDFAFNMGTKTSLGDQGLASRVWALISIDSMQYSIPAGSKNTRDSLLTELLSKQCLNGGFALTGKYSDPDITAMVVQALAPYYNRTQTYTYKRINDGTTASKTVRKVIDESLALLSSLQKNTGDFTAGWTQARNPQTTAQVALALTCLGIDPQKDNRFIKNGKSLVDGMLVFLQPDKGFKATVNSPGSDIMASSQVLYTMAAIIRNMKNMRRLYDFRPEQPATLKANITKIIAEIEASSEQTTRPKLLSLSNSYKLIVDDEKMYVYNYTKLYDLLNAASISSSSPTSGKNDNLTSTSSNTGSGFVSAYTDSSFSKISGANIASSSNSGNINSFEGNSQDGKGNGSNNQKSSDRNQRVLIIVIIFVLIISGATLNFYMIRKARIKR